MSPSLTSMNDPRGRIAVMKSIRGCAVLSVAAVVLSLGPLAAQARTELTRAGSMGDAGAKSECPAGQQLVGFSGRTGTWIDRIQIVCATPQANGRMTYPAAVGGEFGGTGGGRSDGFCPQDSAMNAIQMVLTTGDRQVAAIHLECASRVTGEHFKVTFGNAGYVARCGSGLGVGDCGISTDTNQRCPADETPIGINVRYGKDVNGLGLICGRVVAAAAPPSAPAAAPPSAPPPAARAPSGPAPVSTYAFAGVWDITTNQNTHVTMTVTPLTREGLPGMAIPVAFAASVPTPDFPGHTPIQLHGQTTSGSHDLPVTLARGTPAANGNGVLHLSADGNTLTGEGVFGGVAFTWRGTRKR